MGAEKRGSTRHHEHLSAVSRIGEAESPESDMKSK